MKSTKNICVYNFKYVLQNPNKINIICVIFKPFKKVQKMILAWIITNEKSKPHISILLNIMLNYLLE